MANWDRIAKSEVWLDFWESEEVTQMINGTERLLLKGRHQSLSEVARLQGRLDILRELRDLPERLSKIELEKMSAQQLLREIEEEDQQAKAVHHRFARID